MEPLPGYDAWKLQCPDDEDPPRREDEDPAYLDHVDAEIDRRQEDEP